MRGASGSRHAMMREKESNLLCVSGKQIKPDLVNKNTGDDILLLAVSADIGRVQPATSGGSRLILASLFKPMREKMVHATQYRIATRRVLGSLSMAASVATGIESCPSAPKSGVLPATVEE